MSQPIIISDIVIEKELILEKDGVVKIGDEKELVFSTPSGIYIQVIRVIYIDFDFVHFTRVGPVRKEEERQNGADEHD